MRFRPAWNKTLRSRITVSMLAISIVGSGLIALSVFLTNQGLEDIVLERQIHDEYSTLITQSKGRPHLNRVDSALLKSYVGINNPKLPPELADLHPGDYHGVALGDRRYQVLVTDFEESRFFLTYDITEWENRERAMIFLLILGVVVVSIATMWLGLWISQQIVAPVNALADRVTSIQPDERNTRIAKDFEGVEVSLIAQAFDRFLKRLDGFVSREQLFTSAASHELRTPLAVMQGAADILQEQSGHNELSKRAIDRIQRANREMFEFIEALLFLSREPEKLKAVNERTDLGAVTRKMVDDHNRLLNLKVPITYNQRNSVTLTVPPSLPAIVISNLLRNAVEHTDEGSIVVELVNNTLTIKDSGTGIDQKNIDSIFDLNYTTKPDGSGMGLHIVKRVCDRCGWELRVQSQKLVGTVVSLGFPHIQE